MRRRVEFARFYIPFVDLKSTALSSLDKLLYAYCRNYICKYGITTKNIQLAERYGVSLNQIKHSISKLNRYGLIYIKGKTNSRRIFCFNCERSKIGSLSSKIKTILAVQRLRNLTSSLGK